MRPLIRRIFATTSPWCVIGNFASPHFSDCFFFVMIQHISGSINLSSASSLHLQFNGTLVFVWESMGGFFHKLPMLSSSSRTVSCFSLFLLLGHYISTSSLSVNCCFFGDTYASRFSSAYLGRNTALWSFPIYLGLQESIHERYLRFFNIIHKDEKIWGKTGFNIVVRQICRGLKSMDRLYARGLREESQQRLTAVSSDHQSAQKSTQIFFISRGEEFHKNHAFSKHSPIRFEIDLHDVKHIRQIA